MTPTCSYTKGKMTCNLLSDPELPRGHAMMLDAGPTLEDWKEVPAPWPLAIVVVVVTVRERFNLTILVQ